MGTLGVTMGLQALQGIQSYNSQKQQAANQISYLNAEGQAALTRMNYSLQNMEMQRQAAFTNTVNSMMEANKQGTNLVSSVQAAVNEAGDSRGGRRLVRDSESSLDNALTNLQSQYQQQSNEIDQNKWLTWQDTNFTLDNINSTKVAMPSLSATILNTAASMMGTYSAFKGIQANKQAAGITNGSTTDFTIPRLNLTGNTVGSRSYTFRE